jgi:hypothetical protein
MNDPLRIHIDYPGDITGFTGITITDAIAAQIVARAGVMERLEKLEREMHALPCPICTMPMDDEDGGCVRHSPDEIAAWMRNKAQQPAQPVAGRVDTHLFVGGAELAPLQTPTTAAETPQPVAATDMDRAFKDYAYARSGLIHWAVAWEYIADAPFPWPSPAVLAQALQDGARLACAVTNQDGYKKPATAAETGAGDDVMASVIAAALGEVLTVNRHDIAARAVFAAIRAGKVPGICADNHPNALARRIAAEAAHDTDYYRREITELRTKLSEAEKRADEMEGKAVEWIAVDVHRAKVEAEIQDKAVHIRRWERAEAERDDLAKRLEAATRELAGARVMVEEESRRGIAALQSVDKLKADLATARESEQRFRAEVEDAFRKHGFAAGPTAIDRLVEDLAAANERADALRKEVDALKTRKATYLEPGFKLRVLWEDKGGLAEVYKQGFMACAEAAGVEVAS